MRTDKELLIILRDYMIAYFKSKRITGVCSAATHLHLYNKVNAAEYVILSNFLFRNLPKGKYQVERVLNGKYFMVKGESFCWKPCSLKPRLNWIKKQIERL